MLNKIWEGKHFFIWVLVGSPHQVVAKAISCGISGLLVKAWDGREYWPQIEEIAPIARDAGLTMGAWGYSYGMNIPGEVDAMRRAVEVGGADWLIIDAEHEYERHPARYRVQWLGEKVVDLKVPVALTSFGLPLYHTNFPWEDFAGFCQVVMPQIYWREFRKDPVDALEESLITLRRFGFRKIVPVGQAYGGVTVEEITRFVNACEEAGVPGVAFWEWFQAGEEVFQVLAEMGRRDTVSDWAKDSWDKAVAKGAFDGTNPKGTVTREMLAVVLDRLGLLDWPDIPQEAVDELVGELIVEKHPARARVTWGEFATVLKRVLAKAGVKWGKGA